MWRNHNIAVVVPAYCEERLLPETLETMPDFVDRVIVVDDGSPDDTYEVARRRADVDDRIEALRLGYNSGVGAAIVAGYRRALELHADVVAVMAADAQMDPDDLERVLAPIVDGDADYSKGDRLAHRRADEMPTVRRLGTQILAAVTGLVAGEPQLSDSQCGYTAVSAAILRELPLDELYPRYGYPNDLLLRLAECDAELAQPAVRPVYGDEVSGFHWRAVIAPISAILLRGAGRRMWGPIRRRLREAVKAAVVKS